MKQGPTYTPKCSCSQDGYAEIRTGRYILSVVGNHLSSQVLTYSSYFANADCRLNENINAGIPDLYKSTLYTK